MNKILTLWILILVLLSGCAKQTYYFSETATESNSYQQMAKNNIPPATQTKITAIEADTSGNVASSGLEVSNKKNIPSEAKAIAQYLMATKKAKTQNITATKEDSGIKHILKKKLYKQALADEKPANKNAKAGFILSLVGLGLVLAGLLYGPLVTIGFLVSIAGIIFSAIGFSQIKKNPDVFGNKVQAAIGLAISIGTVVLTLLLALLFLLFLIIFFSAYSTV